jgi:hypothetical protein
MKFKSTKHLVNYLFEQKQEKANLVFLIGPPAVGKTEYIKKNLTGYTIVNRDELVERIAKETGVGTYDDMYARPPADLKDKAGVPPGKDVISAYDKDPEAKAQVDEYLQNINDIAKDVPPSEKYGDLLPFTLKNLQDVIVRFGVKPEFINPFMWKKIEEANEKVAEELANVRNKAVGNKQESRKNFAIDMVSMSVGERNSHRKDILKALGEDPSDLQKVNDHYNQIAIVFSPEGGYTPELIDQIKKVATLRQGEIKMAGGSKTIPPQAYDRMFASYAEPTTEEGFSEIKHVGVPSLAKLKDSEVGTLAESIMFNELFDKASILDNSINIDQWGKMAGILKG